MKKKNGLAFYLLIVIYVVGLLAGGLYQVHIKEQTEMYQYLKNGVSVYDESILGSIKAVAGDNVPELLIMILCAYLPFGLYIIGGVLAFRGFMTGFAITACLRVYGMLGWGLSIGNALSAVIVVPCFIYYGIFIYMNSDSVGKVKLGVFSLIILVLVLGLDSVFKGALSSVAIRLCR